MRRVLTIASACVFLAAGIANAAPGHGGGKERQAQPVQGQKQAQTREAKRMEEQVREHQDEAQGKAARAEEQVRSREMREGEAAGSARSAEMQARQQERQEIKEEYRSAQRSGEGEKVKGKKPWWKFWGSEDEPN